MKKTFFFALLASLTCLQCNPPSKDKPGGDSATAKADEPAETIKKLDYYAQDKTRKEVSAAEFAAGRTPIVYFWANWWPLQRIQEITFRSADAGCVEKCYTDHAGH